MFLLVSTDLGEGYVDDNRFGFSEADVGILSGFAFGCAVLLFAFATVVRNSGSRRVHASDFDKELERAARETRMGPRSDHGSGG